MPRSYFILSACFLAGTLFGAVGIQAATAQGNQRAAIVSDEQNGIVRIVIDDKEVARFTADGLEVRDDVRFGGVITDQGQDAFNQPAGERQ